MSDVTQLLNAAATGDPRTAAELLPLVDDELRRLTTHRLVGESNNHTLQPTALVTEARLKISGDKKAPLERAPTFLRHRSRSNAPHPRGPARIVWMRMI